MKYMIILMVAVMATSACLLLYFIISPPPLSPDVIFDGACVQITLCYPACEDSATIRFIQGIGATMEYAMQNQELYDRFEYLATYLLFKKGKNPYMK